MSRDGRLRRYWDRQAAGYDRKMKSADRHFFGDTRAWVCGQAVGDTLEVALGTGLNLPHYPPGVALTGVEWSPRMLAVARERAASLGRAAELVQGDAQALRYADASFDTVVCVFGLCAIPDDRAALAEMARVLKPGGLLLLADHVGSTVWPIWLGQLIADAVAIPTTGEHFRRRPYPRVRDMGFDVERRERFKAGMVERLAARKPGGQ